MAALAQRRAIEGERQYFTFRLTRRTVPMTFSMMFVQASERRSSGGSPSFVTVSISSSPSRIEAETPSQSFSRCRARLRRSVSAGVGQLPGLPQHAPHLCMHRYRQAVHDVACFMYLTALNGHVASESRSDRLGESLRAVDDEKARQGGIEAAVDEIIDQRLHGRCVFCGALDQPKRVCRRSHQRRSPPPGSCPRPCECRRSGSPPTRGRKNPAPSIPSVAPPTARQNAGRRPISTNQSRAGTSPSGKRTERSNLRVETLISIWFMAP